MHHSAAGKIDKAELSQPAKGTAVFQTIPDPMSEYDVHSGDKRRCDQVAAESHTFRNGAGYDGDRGAAKDKLKDKEGRVPR